jgi:hypothetical protein
MNMEDFITGHPSTETAFRDALREVLGEELQTHFFERFLEAFFGPEDANHLGSLGLNLVRLPVNYRHLEDDREPFQIREDGFRHLDRAIEACADAGLYTIIDLHALPGGQNPDWHSDNPTHLALLWRYREFQDRTVNIWKAIARRYRGHPWVAGYNPINEPYAGRGQDLLDLYTRLLAAIRQEDPDHIVFLDGNRHSTDFKLFSVPWPNVVYAAHDYALPGFIDGGPYPGVTRGEYVDRDAVERKFLERTTYMRETGTPIWIGEFGPVYPTGGPSGHDARYQVLRDQLEIYERHGANWAIWTYKDVGLQGLVHTDPRSPWMARLAPVLEKKARLGVDQWGSVDAGVRNVLQPLEDLLGREFPDFQPSRGGQRWLIHRLVRHVLLAEALVGDLANAFEGAGRDDLDKLADSFRFADCVRRTRLEQSLRLFAAARAN